MQHSLMFMFPGVGSHYSGMGETFYKEFRIVRDLFTEASDILHNDIGKLCFAPECATDLDQLENAQVALLCVSVATYRVLVAETGLEQAIYLGYSLGEYSALCCAGALSLRDALLLVRERGVIVSEVAAKAQGTMAWIVNIAAEQVEQICQEMRGQGEEIYVSAYDTPAKTSLSGTREALHEAGERIVAAGGIPIPIKMSGPFHSPLMLPAAEKFRQLCRAHSYRVPRFPVIANLTARPYGNIEEIPESLTLQLANPIRWQGSLEYALGQGVTTSVEIGPKNVLTYLLEKNAQHMKMYVVDTTQALQGIRAQLLMGRDEYLRFLSRCLTTIAGTKNDNGDISEYQEKVVLPFRKIQSLYDDVEAGTLSPNSHFVDTVMAMVEAALQAKHLQEKDRTARMKRVSEPVPGLRNGE